MPIALPDVISALLIVGILLIGIWNVKSGIAPPVWIAPRPKAGTATRAERAAVKNKIKRIARDIFMRGIALIILVTKVPHVISNKVRNPDILDSNGIPRHARDDMKRGCVILNLVLVIGAVSDTACPNTCR